MHTICYMQELNRIDIRNQYVFFYLNKLTGKVDDLGVVRNDEVDGVESRHP